ncbi:MAG: AAA family ATPase [Aeromicrobium sp.]|uniref:AAA family ATPase n=1 Tax=Aeromicrobium sp. TaxID=1871063 RepID=UPI0039E68BCB
MSEDYAPLERRAVVTWASEIEPEPVVWAWAEGGLGRIPAGSLSMAAGREATGKSSFGIWLAAQVTRGTLPGSLHGTPRRVLYGAVEDSWRKTIVARFIAAGADLDRVGRFEVVNEVGDHLTLSLPSDLALLEQTITAHEVALVVVDPLVSAVNVKDTHKESDVRTALDPLARLADRTGAVVLGIGHFNKAGGTDAANLITGSGAFKNVPRSVFGFARDESSDDDRRIITQVKNSLGRSDLPSLAYRIEGATVTTPKGPTETGRLVMLGESAVTVAEALRNAGTDPEERDDRRDAAAWVVDYLVECGGEAPSKDVYRAGQAAGGWSKDQLKRAKGRLVESRKSGMGSGWVWTLVDRETSEGSTKGVKGAGNCYPLPSHPSVLPSDSDISGPGDTSTSENEGTAPGEAAPLLSLTTAEGAA